MALLCLEKAYSETQLFERRHRFLVAVRSLPTRPRSLVAGRKRGREVNFTEDEKERLKKVTHLLDSGWKPVFNPPASTLYTLERTPDGVVSFGPLENLNFEDAVTVQRCIERLKP